MCIGLLDCRVDYGGSAERCHLDVWAEGRFFVVRALLVDEALRHDFDHWHQVEDLPDALKGFNARRAWRGWSAVDPLAHHAYYEFDSLAQAQAISASDTLKRLVAEFDRVRSDKVIRSRDFVDVVQALGS